MQKILKPTCNLDYFEIFEIKREKRKQHNIFKLYLKEMKI